MKNAVVAVKAHGKTIYIANEYMGEVCNPRFKGKDFVHFTTKREYTMRRKDFEILCTDGSLTVTPDGYGDSVSFRLEGGKA